MTSADSLNRLGCELGLKGDEEGARLHYLAALSLDPFHVPSMANLAVMLSSKNQLQPAATLLRRVVEMVPHDGLMWSHYGNVLTRLERYDEAKIAVYNAQKLAPENPAVWHNSTLLAHRTGDNDLAMECMRRVEAIGGENGATINDRAHIYLARGELERGLVDYEARWHTLMHLEPWDFHIVEWTGQDLLGKTILVHAEQGFGDTIMTSRFVLNLLRLGAKVTLGLPPGLCSLFDYQDWSIETLSIPDMTEEDAKGFDFHSPLYSAMRYLGVRKETINPEPFLKAPEVVGPRVPKIEGALNVGICWASGQRGTQMDWRRRVSPLRSWLKLADNPRVLLWNLMPEQSARDEIAEVGAEGLVHDRSKDFTDFAQTALFVDQMDLVISVDTAVVHLAGAMNKPTWMLSQFTPCWRWWDINNGTGRPWYESVTILKQPKPGDWDSQLDLCCEMLRDMIPVRQLRAAE